MQIPQDVGGVVDVWVSTIVGEDRLPQSADVLRAIELVGQRSEEWWAPVYIGVYAAWLNLISLGDSAATDPYRQAQNNLAEVAFEPLEALLKSLDSDVGASSQTQSSARLRFHTRYALGFVLQARGEKQRATAILHEAAATRLKAQAEPGGGETYSSGHGLLDATRDVREGKSFAAMRQQLIVSRAKNILGEDLDYEEALHMVYEACRCIGNRGNAALSSDLLDYWAQRCDQVDQSGEFDFPDLSWLSLFAAAADILSVSAGSESVGDVPQNCDHSSAQYQAWQFGQLAGRFAVADDRWRGVPIEKIWPLDEYIAGGDLDESESERLWSALTTVAGLLAEGGPERDWERQRDRYLAMWKRCGTFHGLNLGQIGTECDLYWALRIGFADKMLEQTAWESSQTSFGPTSSDVESIKDIVIATSLRQLREQQDVERVLGRLPPTPQEIRGYIREQLGDAANALPGMVMSHFIKAEQYYRTEVDDEDAKVWFHKGVESLYAAYFVEPLVSYMQRHDIKLIGLPFPPERGTERRNIRFLRRTSLSEWGTVVGSLGSRSSGLADLGRVDLTEFAEKRFGKSVFPSLLAISKGLREFSQLRGGSAHHRDALVRYEEGRQQLVEMRAMVLGISKDSIVTHIVEILSPRQ